MFSQATCEIGSWAVRRELLETCLFSAAPWGSRDPGVSREGRGSQPASQGSGVSRTLPVRKCPKALVGEREQKPRKQKVDLVLISTFRIDPCSTEHRSFTNWSHFYLVILLIFMKNRLTKGIISISLRFAKIMFILWRKSIFLTAHHWPLAWPCSPVLTVYGHHHLSAGTSLSAQRGRWGGGDCGRVLACASWLSRQEGGR